jgi:hypothetical protein
MTCNYGYCKALKSEDYDAFDHFPFVRHKQEKNNIYLV